MNKNLSYSYLFKKSWPIILANAAGPLLGFVDTAVIGNYGTVADLGAIAFGAFFFSFVYLGFGFLRMATTGYVAQAVGAKDELEIRAALGRSLLLGLIFGVSLLLLQKPIAALVFSSFNISTEIYSPLRDYVFTRIWGAPAILASFAINGFFIGLGDSKRILKLQLLLNILNITLDTYFAGYLNMGIKGIALGTLIAEVLTFSYGFYMVTSVLKKRNENRNFSWPLDRIKNLDTFLKTLKAKSHIFIRTLLLMFGFAYFINQSAQFGDKTLAANYVLLQFLTFSAFFLDGYSFVIESLVGKSIGAKNALSLKIAVTKSSVLAAFTAIILAGIIYYLGPFLIDFLTDLKEVRSLAKQSLIYSSIYVLLAFPAFLLDGIFIGASLTKQMRDASILSTLVFIFASWMLIEPYGISGLWYAFIIFVSTRSLALGLFYKDLSALFR